MHMLALVGVGIVVFASTNVDDILLLAVFFADPRVPPRSVVAGQFLGIGVLVLASALAALAALAVPEGWVALLGLVPLALGLHLLREQWGGGAPEAEEEQDAGALGIGERSARAQALAVAGVTVANGGDNLGVYIPLFARDPGAIPVYAAIFAALTALWCWAGYRLVTHPWLGDRMRRVGSRLLPWVLAGLGIWILSDARVLLR